MAKRDEIFFGILAQPCARMHMVYLKLGARPTELAAPAVTFQHMPVQLFVLVSLKPLAFHGHSNVRESRPVAHCSTA
jgi:hypothetical protein